MPDQVEETARRLYPTSSRQRYADKYTARQCQRAYMRGHAHGAMLDQEFVQALAREVGEGHMDGREGAAKIIVEHLEARGFAIPPKKE